MMEFPRNFFWGAATSAYQVEGNNLNSDWWEWEQRVGLKEVSGEACRHYQLYKEDFELAKSLNHNAHRLSIEWSRIEPEEGRFSEEAIRHYIDVILSLRELNLEPIVTIHHFTNPLWFAKLGGWMNKKAAVFFLRYVEKITQALCEKVRYWVTINEPMVYVYCSYISGEWPPQEKSFLKSRIVTNNLISAHIKSYKLIRNIYKEKNLSMPLISIAHNIRAFVPYSLTLKNMFSAYLRDRLFNFEIIERLTRHKTLDFIGINYYTRDVVGGRGRHIKGRLPEMPEENNSEVKKNDLGWDIYPQGLYALLIRLKKYNLPIFILESGICTEDDNARWDFIFEHLKNVYRAMIDGVDVLGYIYWSLIDNYEWDKGFGPRFGLIEVDYSTYRRTIRESARKFSLVCKSGKLL